VKVSWDDDIPNIWKVIKFLFQKPPTRWLLLPDGKNKKSSKPPNRLISINMEYGLMGF
jgi:hypothetical protein